MALRNQQIPSALHGNLPFLLIKLFRIQENPIFVPGTGLCQWRILPEATSVIGGSPTGALQLNLISDLLFIVHLFSIHTFQKNGKLPSVILVPIARVRRCLALRIF